MNEGNRPPIDAFSESPNWSREQLLLAFQFYCENPFGKLHSRNQAIIDLANLIGRTPGALAMKCVNFASLDPRIRDSGRAGLGNVSARDRAIWAEFHANWEGLVEECERLHRYLRKWRGSEGSSVADAPQCAEQADFHGGTRAAVVEQRVGQGFFRRAVLSGYDNKCCISGVTDRRFLIASHIVRWSEDPSIRLHPGNGLCLSAIHDKAFDNCLFSLTDDYRIVLSRQLRDTKDAFLRDVFVHLEGSEISLPDKFVPEREFIARHRDRMNREPNSESPR